MSHITLSPTHGLNLSIMQCFFCMDDSGVALLGRLPNDEEAPRKICLDHVPCSKCKEYMERGIILISVSDRTDSTDNPYRTGGWVVVSEQFIKRIVQPYELVEEILRKRCAFLPDAVWDKLSLPRGG